LVAINGWNVQALDNATSLFISQDQRTVLVRANNQYLSEITIGDTILISSSPESEVRVDAENKKITVGLKLRR
jgi:anthranilate/para-aminobenzoate synthase component I